MSYAALGYLRQQYLCVLRRCAWFNAAMASALMCLPSVGVQANSIVTDGRTQTQVTVNGSITDITTQTIRGANAYNSFSQFSVDTANTVNLYLPGQTTNLLNLVHDQQSYINGLVNAYKDGRIGGNVFFLNPHGIVVGADGVLNVGSLTLVTPTAAFMNQMISPAGVIDDAATDLALTGQIPLSQTGLILVKGRINAADAVTLAGGGVDVAAGARVLAGAQAQVAFSDLVNVQGLATAADVRVDGGVIRIVAAEDITVAGQVSADGLGADANGGSVTVMAERNARLEAGAELSARGGEISGDGGFVEFSAKDTVELAGGSLRADAVLGQAGTILIDPENLTVSADLLRAPGGNANVDGITWDAGSLVLQADQQLIIADNVVISSRDVGSGDRAAHIGGASVGDSGNLTLKGTDITLGNGSMLLADADNGHAGGDVLVQATDVNAVGADRAAEARIKAEQAVIRGRNVKISAIADTSLIVQVLEQTPDISLDDAQAYLNNEMDDLVSDGPGGEYLAIKTEATAKTELYGTTVQASGDVTIEARAGARAGFEKIATADVIIGDLLDTDGTTVLATSDISGATVTIASTADTSLTFNVLGNVLRLADQSWLPSEDSGEIQLLNDQLFDFSEVPLVSLSTATARTTINGDTSIVAGNTVDIGATGISAAKPTFSSPLLFAAAWGESTVVANTQVGGTTQLEATNKVTVRASTDAEVNVTATVNSINKPIDAVFVRADSIATTTAQVGDDTTTTAGSVEVLAATKADISAGALAKNTGGSGVGIAVAVNESTTTTSAILGGDVNALTGDVKVDATADILKNNTSAEAATLGNPNTISAKITNFKAGIQRNVTSGILNATGKLKPGTSDRISSFLFPGIKEGKFNLSGAVTYTDAENNTSASVAADADVMAEGGIDITALINDRPNASVGAKATSTGTAIGGSAIIASFTNNADAYIGQDATVDAKGALLVDAQTYVPYPWQIDWSSPAAILNHLQDGILDLVLTSYAINSASGKSGLGLAAAVSVFGLENNADAWIDEGAKVNTIHDKDTLALPEQSVTVHARNDINTVNAVGILSKKFLGTSGGKAGIGGAGNIIDITENASATIRGDAEVKSEATLDVKAENLNQLVTVTEAGGSSDQVGIEGAVSINTLNGSTVAAIDDDSRVDTGGNISVEALSDVEIISVAGGVVATKGQVGIGFSVSVNNIDTDTRAYIGNYDPLALDTAPALGQVETDGDLKIKADSGTEIGAYSVAGALATSSSSQTSAPDAGAGETKDGAGGAGGSSGSGKGKFGIAVSGDASVNDIEADTLAYVSDGADVAQADDADIEAVNTLAISALAGAVTISTQQEGNGLAGSYAQNTLGGTTAAYVDDATLALGGDLDLDAHVTGEIKTLSASVQGTKGKIGVAGSVSVNEITNQTQAYLAGSMINSVQAVNLTALDDSSIKSIAGAIAFGGKAGIGLSFAWNDMDNTTQAYVDTSDIDATLDVILSATTDNSIDTISAAIGASKGNLAGAGAVAVNTLSNETGAWISGQNNGDGVDSAGSIKIGADDQSRIFAIAGGVGATSGQAGVGLSFAWSDVNNSVAGGVKSGADVESSAGDVEVTADSTTEIQAFAVGGGAANKVGIAGSVSVVQGGNSVSAIIDGTSRVAADGNVLVAASDDVDIFSLAGSVAGAGTAAIAAANSTLITDNTVEAGVGAGAQITARGKHAADQIYSGEKDDSGNRTTESVQGLAVSATSFEDIQTIAAGGAGAGKVGLAGSATVTVMDEKTYARIGAGAKVNEADDGAAGQDVLVRSSDDTTLLGVAGAVAFGGSAGVGAGADVGVIDKDTQATIDSSAASPAVVKAKDNVIVEARNIEEITSVAASLAAGGSAGVAGSASVYDLGLDTLAMIGDSAQVRAEGSVVVSADDATEMDLIAGNGAFGGTAGVGASAAVQVIDKTVTASIGANAQVDGLGKTDAVDVADGGFAVAFGANSGDEGEISAPTSEDSGSDSQALSQQRSATRATRSIKGVAVSATNKDDIESISATGSIAGTAAVTLAGNVNVITTNTSAGIGEGARINQDTAGADAGQSVLVAAGNDYYHMGVAGSGSGAGAVGIGVGVDVTVADLTTSAGIGQDALVDARKDVEVLAQAQEEVLSISASLGVAGTVGVSGSVSTLVLDTATSAYTGTGSTVDAGGNVRIAAQDDTETDMIAGTIAIGIGAAGVGGAVGVTSIGKDTTAMVGAGATVNARGNDTGTMAAYSGDSLDNTDDIKGLSVEAASSEDVFSVAAAGAGGFYAGVSGAVTVQTLDSDTHASIGADADINKGVTDGGTEQDVNVSARNSAKSNVVTGSLAVGAVGAAGGVDVGSFKNDTGASIGTGAEVYAERDVDVNALSKTEIDSIVVSASGGLGAIAGGVAVYSVGTGLDQESKDRLKSDGGDFADVNSYADDQASDNSIASLLAGSDDSRIQSISAEAQTKRSAISTTGQLNDPTPSGNAAFIGAATVEAGRHVDVDARQRIDTDILAGAASIGALGLGAGVGVVNVNGANQAFIAGTAWVNAGDDIMVTAHTDATGNLDTYAGTGGIVALDAAVAIYNDTTTTAAYLGDGVRIDKADQVDIDAVDRRDIDAHAFGASIGAAAAGISLAEAELGGTVQASVGANAQIGQTADSVGGLSIDADAQVTAETDAEAAKAGLGLAAGGAAATSSADLTVSASIGAGSDVTVTNGVEVLATAKATADADALGVNVSLGGGVGGSVAMATVSPTVTAFIGADSEIDAASLLVKALQDVPASGIGAHANATGAAGGLLAGVNATYSEATNDGQVTSYVGDDSTLDISGLVRIEAENNTRQHAEAWGLSVGILAAGANIAEAGSETLTHAWLGDGVRIDDGGTLSDEIRVSATGKDDNFAESVSGSGGLVSGAAATASTSGVSDTRAWTGGGDATHRLQAETFRLLASHTTQFNGTVDSINASLVGASGASASHTVISVVDASVGDDGWIMANHVDIDAENASHKFWLGADSVAEDAAGNGDGAGNNITSGSGGVIDAPAGSSISHVTHVTGAGIGEGAQVHVLLPSLGVGTFNMDAFNDIIGHDKVKMDSGGAVALAKVASHFIVDGAAASVVFGKDSEVISDEGDINAGASARVDLDTRATADTYGLAGAPLGEAYSHYAGLNQAIVEGGALIRADEGAVNLAGGRSSAGVRTSIVAESDVKLWNKTAIPIATVPDAQSFVVSDALVDVRDDDVLDDQLQGDAQVWAAGDISLYADKGQVNASAVGIGKDIYREALAALASAVSNLFGGGDVSFEIHGGESSVGGTGTARVDGEVLTGINRYQSLTLDYQLVDQNGDVVETPVQDPNSGLVLWKLLVDKTDGVTYDIDRAVGVAAAIQGRIDKLRSLMAQYAADPIAVAAYDAEIKFLQFKLVELGLASQDPNTGAINVGEWNNPSPKESTASTLAQSASQAIGEQAALTGDPGDASDKGAVGEVIADFDTVDQNNGSFSASTLTVNGNLAMLSKYNANDARISQINLLAASSDTLRFDINSMLNTNRSLQQSISEKTAQINDLLIKPTLSATDFASIESLASEISSLVSQVATNDGLINSKTDTLHGNLDTIADLQSELATAFRETDNTKAGYNADLVVLNRITPLASTNSARIGEIDTASTTIGNAYSDHFDPGNTSSYTSQLSDLSGDLPGESSTPANGPIADFVIVDDITVRLGNIDIVADNLVGGGALKAPGDASIVITNNTPNFLVLNDLTVASDSGGMIRLNNFLINDNAEINAINASRTGASFGEIQTRDNQGAGLPEIIIQSNYDPNSAKDKKLPAPSPDIQLAGDVSNSLGLVQVRSKAGSIYVDGNIRAAQVDVRADNGDFVQSYVDGFYHVAGDPATNTQGGTSTTLPGAGIVANGSVFISARYLNINGLVQSGIESWTLTLPAAPILTGPADLYGLSQSYLDTLAEAYKNGGAARTLVASNSGGSVYYDAADGRLEADIGFADADKLAADWSTRTGKYSGLYPLAPDYGNIGSNYDPSVVGGRYVLDGTLVRGGYIQLYGQIVNTADGSAGKLRVLDGYGQIVITNPTDRPVVINNLDTGIDPTGTGRGMAGVIDITDIQRVTNNANNTSTVDAIHTVITRENGQIYVEQTGRWNGANFEPDYTFSGLDGNASDGRHTEYNPQAGLRYVWTTAMDTSTNTYWHFSGSQFLGISQLRTQPTGSVVSKSGPYTLSNRRLDDGTYLSQNTGQVGTRLINSSNTYTTSDLWTKTGEWTNCNWWTLCIAQNYHTTWTQTTASTTVTRHSLKADYPIVIEFIGWDAGLVAINSRSTVSLEGVISNRYGETTVTAGVDPGGNPSLVLAGQSILQGDPDSLVSSRNLSMLASGGIGTLLGNTYAPIEIDLNGGVLNAVAANGNVAVAQTTGDLSIGLVSAAGSANAGLGLVSLEAEGDITMASDASILQGNRVELTSLNGGIGDENDSLNVRTGYTDDLTQRGGYGLKASARDGIYLENESWSGNPAGDLLVSSVVSATGDVVLSTPGRILDNNPFESIDQRTYDQLLAYWENLGLLEDTDGNQDKQDNALKAFEQGATQEYRTYWNVRNRQANPATYDPNFQYAMTTAQEQAVRDDLARQGKNETEIDAFVADYELQKTAEYHDLHQKLYDPASGGYDNAIPDSYNAAFVYDASSAEEDGLLHGSSWTERELGISITPGLLKEITDTNPVLKDPNVSGQNVSLLAGTGLGATQGTVEISTSIDPRDLTDAQKVALAAAERSDLDLSDPTKIVISQQKPLNFDAAQTLYATNSVGGAIAGNVYLASESPVNVGALFATGEARLKAAGSISDVAGAGIAAFQTGTLVLESAQGSIGTADSPVHVQIADGESLIARAEGDIFIEALAGDLEIDTVFSREDISLATSGSILDAFDTDDLNIRARSLDLMAGGSIGDGANFLDIGLDVRLPGLEDTDPDGWLTASAGTGIYLRNEQQPVIIRAADAGTEAYFIGGDLTVDGTVDAPLGIDIATGGQLTLTDQALLKSPANPLVISADSLRTEAGTGAATLDAGSIDLTVVGSAEFAGDLDAGATDVNLMAGDDILFSGGTLMTEGAVNLAAGTDGGGSILGHAGDGADVRSGGLLTASAPDSVGEDEPLEFLVGSEARINARRVNAQVATIDVADPLTVSVAGPSGGLAEQVELDLTSESRVLVEHLASEQAVVDAHTPRYSVTLGQLGDYALHYTPTYAIRVDHQDRAPHPGFDVHAFTLSGDYSLDVLPNTAYIGAFVISQNPRLIVYGDPPGSADLESSFGLRSLESSLVFPNLANILLDEEPEETDLVSIPPGLMDEVID